MREITCPVTDIIRQLSRMLAEAQFKTPKGWRIAEEMLKLFRDIATGRAGEAHLPALAALAAEMLAEGDETAAAAAGTTVKQVLADHRETLLSHVHTNNCPTGDCVELTPAPCQMACPAGIDVPTYVTLIGLGRDAEAIEVIREDNPFPWVCGLVCTRPCEFMCVRGRIDSPVSIKFLKAFAAERAFSERRYQNPAKAPAKPRKVCVVGAGPGGMSAAYYLALKGYTVRVLEALPVAGGMMMIGIPRYRLPREVIDREVAMIQELGVDFRFNTRFGTDVSLAALQQEGFEAFLFAIGAHQPFSLGIPGEKDYPQVIDAIDLLKKVALGDRQRPGRRVVVIGGGNVAIDAARTCIRLGCDEVTIAYRRTRTEMPADKEEVDQAEEEGVRLEFLTIPVEIQGQDGRVTALKCQRARLVKREDSDRRTPVPIADSHFPMAVDAVVAAIGQRVDPDGMEILADLKWTRRSTIDVNMASMETAMPGVFAVGDAVTGPATVIEAIGGGKRAAEAIDRYLERIPQPKMPPVPVRRARLAFIEVAARTKMDLERPAMPLLNIDRRRTTYQQVELGYAEADVRAEARRCLRCDICRRCGDCVMVCRDRMKIDALQLGYLDFDHPVRTDFARTAETCIACGACAENCPNRAMRIEDCGDERVLSLCGTVLNRQKLVRCKECGRVVGPARYLDFIQKRFKGAGQVAVEGAVCERCARTGSHRSGVPVSSL